MLRTTWLQLLKHHFSRPGRSTRRRRSAPVGAEVLEERALLATYGVSGTTLNIDLDSANQKLQIYANGTSYVFALSTAATNTWTLSGTLPSGHSITSSAASLTTANLSAFSTVNITDSAANTSVWFETGSNGTFDDNFNLNLDNLSNSVIFNGTSTFNGTNALSVTVDSRVEVPSTKSLTMTNGNLDMSINMQATPRDTGFSGLMVNNGTIQTSGTGMTNITARGGAGSAITHANKGIAVITGGKILGGTAGTMNLTGYGFTGVGGTARGQGVLVRNDGGTATSTISSIGANVSVTGYGSNGTTATANQVNAGVVIGNPGINAATDGGLITSGGSGSVTVTGYGGGLPVPGSTAATVSGGVHVYGSNAVISSGGSGLVTVTGTAGGATNLTTFSNGVGVWSGTITSGTNGSVIVTGSGNTTSASSNHYGVMLINANAIIAAGTGNGTTTVTGTGGGTGAASGRTGVCLTSNATITAIGSGNVNVTGTGGTGSGNNNFGVILGSDVKITANGGDVLVTGQGGGSGTSTTNVGVYVGLRSRIAGTASGKVTVHGYGGNNNGTGGGNNYGVFVTPDGVNQTPGYITSEGGDVTVNGTGGGGAPDSTSASSSGSNYGIFLDQGGYVTAGGMGKVTLTGQGGGRSPGASGNTNHGVFVNSHNGSAAYAFSYVSSSGGDVTVTGSGGGGSGTTVSAGSNNNHGVYVNNGASIRSGGNANVIVTGTGGGFGSSSGNTNVGVIVNSNVTVNATTNAKVNSTITSGGNGNVTIQGQGGGVGTSASNSGVRIILGGIITSGGSGDVTVNGTGGNPNDTNSGSNVGIEMNGTLTSGGGNITANGNGGGKNGINNHGLSISGGGAITGPGNACVSVTGRGGNLDGTSGNTNRGVNITGVTAGVRTSITSNNGTVSVTGYGGQTNSTVSSSSACNTGVYVSAGACISSGGSFPVTVTGFGGGLGTGAQGDNYGVGLQTLNGAASETPQITSAGGTVTVNGTGGGTNGSGTTNHGVSIQTGGRITSAGNGTAVNVIGTGGGASPNNHGVYIAGCTTVSNLTIGSNNGPITITGIAGFGGQGVAGCTTLATVIGNSTTPGNVTIIADSVGLPTWTGSAVNAAERLIITPRTAGVAIDLGGTGGAPAGPLTLSQTELSTLSAATIQLGNSTSGNVTLTSGLTFPTASNVTLYSNGTGSVLSANSCATQGLTLGAGKTLDVSTLPIIAASISGTSLGLGYTQLKVVGDLSIAGKTLSLSGGYTPAAGNVFTIVNATNLTGTFTGLADGSTLTFNGKTLIVNYTSTSVTLTEPSPLVTTSPTSASVTAGATASFTAAASGIPTPTVQWQVSSNSGTSWSDMTGETNPTLSFTAAIADDGQLYRAVFTNTYGTATTTSATLTVQAAPAITTHPSDQTVNPGDTVNFTAAATGSPAPTVKWQVSTDNGSGWTDIAGATSTTYSFTAAFSDDTYQYRAVFTNSINSATTSAATLIVNSAAVPPAVTGNPANSTVTAGSTASFTASAWGNPAPSVKWQLSTNSGTSWSDIAGATSNTYSFTAAAGDNGNQYRAVFTNGVGSDATTNSATLTVQYGPTVTTQPTSQTVLSGATVTFSAAASGNPTPTVKWQSNHGSGWSDIAGATSVTYSFTAAAGDDGVQYRAVFTNGVGSDATTNSATLTVQYGPTVTTQPTSQTVLAGATVTFTAAASGNPTPTVKWQANSGSGWSDIAGATSVTYSFTGAAGDNGVQYRAVFTNGIGSDATTNTATLTVQYGPTVTTQPTSQTVLAGATVTFTAAASGNPTPTVKWQANSGSGWSDIAGATSVTYSFTAAVGDNGVQYRAVFTNGVGSDATTNPATLTIPSLSTFTVSKGQAQRSYVRYLDVGTDSSATANALSLPGRVRLLKADLNGNGSTLVPLTGFVSASGSTLAINFGVAGLGSSRNTNLADGYYTLGLDLDGDGVFESSRRFYRLLGDVNGDRQVNTTDVSLVNAGMSTAYNPVLDINGDGVVNASDLMFVNRARGRKLADGLLLD